jgi:hypothetical protein
VVSGYFSGDNLGFIIQNNIAEEFGTGEVSGLYLRLEGFIGGFVYPEVEAFG